MSQSATQASRGVAASIPANPPTGPDLELRFGPDFQSRRHSAQYRGRIAESRRTGNAIVQPDDTLTLHAGAGESSDREVFLGAESEALALAASPGTRVRLVDATGKVAAETTVPRF